MTPVARSRSVEITSEGRVAKWHRRRITRNTMPFWVSSSVRAMQSQSKWGEVLPVGGLEGTTARNPFVFAVPNIVPSGGLDTCVSLALDE
jgi:hypothetical protein